MSRSGYEGVAGPNFSSVVALGDTNAEGYSPMVDQMKPIMMKNPENMATRPTEP